MLLPLALALLSAQADAPAGAGGLAAVEPSAYRVALSASGGGVAYRWTRGAGEAEAPLREGTLPFEPERLLVARSGAGFAAVGPREGHLASAIVVGRTGGPHELQLAGLWGAEVGEHLHVGLHGAHWLGPTWIDEAGGELVLSVGAYAGPAAGALAAVDLESGRVRRGGVEELGRGLVQGEVAALEVARLRDTGPVLDWLTARVEDERESRPFRTRAAAALALLGRNQGVQALRRLHAEGDAELVRAEALPFVARAVEAGVRGVWDVVAALGEAALPVCVLVLEEERRGIAGAHEAARLIGEHGTREHLPALLGALRSDRPALAHTALDAAWRLAGEDVNPELLHLLREGLAHDDVLALHFLRRRVPGSAPVLRAALARHASGTRAHELLSRALAFQAEE